MKRFISCMLVLALAFTYVSTIADSSILSKAYALTAVEFETYPVPSELPTEMPTSAPTEPTPTEQPSSMPTSEPSPTPSEAASPSPVPSIEPSPTPSPSPASSPLTIGDRGSSVTKLQSELRKLGFSTDSADGIFGKLTAGSVKELQIYMALLSAHGMIPEYNYIEYGYADGVLLDAIYSSSFPVYMATLKSGSSGFHVTRLQTRLVDLDYLLGSAIDGEFGRMSETAVENFQKVNGLPRTGIADEQTQKLLFSSAAKKDTSTGSRYPYKLVIDVSEQRVYVYQYSSGSYSKLKAKFICSTGKVETPTPLGTFRSTEQINRWHYFKQYDIWAQYAYRIVGSIYFHSVLFVNKGDSRPTSTSVRNLGRRASHGCVRLKVEDAKWIYYNCPEGTTVEVRK